MLASASNLFNIHFERRVVASASTSSSKVCACVSYGRLALVLASCCFIIIVNEDDGIMFLRHRRSIVMLCFLLFITIIILFFGHI